MSAELTPWFDMSIPPVHVGPYEVDAVTDIWFAHWNGKHWGYTAPDAVQAVKAGGPGNDCRNGRVTGWRGLASDPAGQP